MASIFGNIKEGLGGLNFERGVVGAFGGQRGLQRYDQTAQNNALVQQKKSQSEAQSNEEKQKDFTSFMGDAVEYISQLPVEERANGFKAYAQIRNKPEYGQNIEGAGYLTPEFLTDESLGAFKASLRGEQVLKDKEVLLGANGQPIYNNRYNAPQVVADGSALVNDSGDALFTNEKDAPPVSPTSDMQNYEAAVKSGYQGSFYDYQAALKAAGKPSTSVTVNGDEKPSVFENEVDKKYAADYLEWRQGGGSDNAKLINQLDDALTALNSGRNITDPILGLLPDRINAIFRPEATDVKDRVSEVVQRNLRLILGAQFTEKEGQQLIARAFNPQLGEKENAKRVSALVKQIRSAADAKESAANYIEKNGTLKGWTGKTYTKADFEAAVDGADTATPKKRRYNPATGTFD